MVSNAENIPFDDVIMIGVLSQMAKIIRSTSIRYRLDVYIQAFDSSHALKGNNTLITQMYLEHRLLTRHLTVGHRTPVSRE